MLGDVSEMLAMEDIDRTLTEEERGVAQFWAMEEVRLVAVSCHI